MTAHSQEHAEFKAVLGELDAAFAGGDAAAFGALLADDTQVMWNDRETIVGRQAVHDAFAGLFSAVDTSEWRPDHHTIEVYADGAYVMSDFTERSDRPTGVMRSGFVVGQCSSGVAPR